MFFARFGRQLDGIWILTFVFTEAIVLIIILVMYDIYCWTLKNLDNLCALRKKDRKALADDVRGGKEFQPVGS